MKTFRSIKGTYDLLPDDLKVWQRVGSQIHKIMQQYGYGEIRTPAFENTELFIRGIGTETDIVNKEMYSWVDQGGNALTLKPELTAPVVRAYLQHQLGNQNPIHRLYYFDSLFRRERPQKGRQRQFYQFGAEAIGSPNPEQDAEIIAMAYRIYQSFDIQEMEVRLNSIGSPEIRPEYLELLRNTLNKYRGELCKTCETRLGKNALRIFDCKNPGCQKVLDEKAPCIFDSISADDHRHFDSITQTLTKMNIPFNHDNKLVRGLDYYSHTTFEISSSALGAQDALCGGGRYNDLIEQLGGTPTPAVGFAAGMERLMLVLEKMEHLESSPDVYFITMGENAVVQACRIAQDLRKECGITVILETLRRSMKSQMRDANRYGTKMVIILGEEELQKNIAVVKDMATSNQLEVPISNIVNYFNNMPEK